MLGSRRIVGFDDAETAAMERGEERRREVGRGEAEEDQSYQEDDWGRRETRRVAVEEETVPSEEERSSNRGWMRRQTWANSRRTQDWCHLMLLGLVMGFGCIFIYAWVEAFREVRNIYPVMATFVQLVNADIDGN